MASIANITAALILDVSRFKGQLEGAEKQILKTNRALQTAGLNMTAAITLPFAMFARDAVKTAAEFGLVQAKIAGLSQQTKVIDGLANSARQLGKDTIFTAVEVSKMQLELVKLGLAEGEIMAIQGAAVQFAQALDIDLASAASTVVELLNKMPGSFEKFNSRAEAAQYATNAFAYAAAESALDVEGLTSSLNYVGAEADAMGFSFEQTVAMLAALANAGYKGSRAGTQLRRIMVELSKGGEEATAEFRRFVQSGASFSEILDQVGIRAAGMGAALQGQQPFIDEFAAGMENSSGYLQNIANVIEDSLAYSIKRTGSAFDELKIAIINDFQPAIIALLNLVSALLTGFSNAPTIIKVVVTAFALMVAVIGPVIIVITRYNLAMAQVAMANARAAASFKILQASMGIIGIITALAAVTYGLASAWDSAAAAQEGYINQRRNIDQGELSGAEEALRLDKQRLADVEEELNKLFFSINEARQGGILPGLLSIPQMKKEYDLLMLQKRALLSIIYDQEKKVAVMKEAVKVADDEAKRLAAAGGSAMSYQSLVQEYGRLGNEISALQKKARGAGDSSMFVFDINQLQAERDEVKGILEALGHSFEKGSKKVDKWQEAINTASAAWNRAEAQFAVDGDEIAKLEAFAAAQRELAIAAELLDKTGTQTGIDALKDFIELTKRVDAAKAAKALADGIDEANAAFSQTQANTVLQLSAGIIDQKAATEQLASAYETLAMSLYELGEAGQALDYLKMANSLRSELAGDEKTAADRDQLLAQQQELLSFVQSIGNAVGNIFKDLTSGSRSFAETLKRNMIDALTAILAKLVAIAVMWGIIAILSGGGSMMPKTAIWAQGLRSGGFGSFAMGQIGLGSLGKNKSMGVTVDGQISGHTIYLSNKRALSSYDRTYGG